MKKANWIWYPNDFEMMLFNRCMSRRYERDVQVTPFWRMDSHYVTVKFYANFCLTHENTVTVKADGTFNIFVDKIGYIKDFDGCFTLPAGEYEMQILVNNVPALPCIYVSSDELISSKESFRVTCQDNVFFPAACWNFDDPDFSPNSYSLPVREVLPVCSLDTGYGCFYDFGREISGKIRFGIPDREDTAEVTLCYGESREEALDECNCEQIERFLLGRGECKVCSAVTKAFRYLNILCKYPITDFSAEETLTEGENRSRLRIDDPLLQKIYDTSVYTLALCKQEFFLDGIKRDRWSWSGDAYQSYLLDYYSFFDCEAVKRTIRALKGKEPVKTHINHIMDYTMYWILSLYDYYFYTGDIEFVREMMPAAEEFCGFMLSRRNEEGFLTYLPDDWVFIDWAPMDNSGETSFEQILFVVTLRRMAYLTEICGLGGVDYLGVAENLLQSTKAAFFKNGRFYHGKHGKVLEDHVTKYANIFAVLFDLVNEEEKKQIVDNVLLCGDVQKITTPYMRFYELIAFCKIGKIDTMIEELKDYWGGMLNEGSTTFWESYNSEEKGVEKYAMYGRKYGKSLCHAWGASPIYLLLCQVLGMKPRSAGYREFELCPKLHSICNFDATLPLPEGNLEISYRGGRLELYADNCSGLLDLGELGKFKIEKNNKYSFVITDTDKI